MICCMPDSKHLLIIAHNPSPNMQILVEATLRGATHEDIAGVEAKHIPPLQANPDDVLWADAIILGTTENFGYMSGALKDFFDRVFDIHIKDVTAAKAEGQTCIIGRGVIDFDSFLKTVIDMNYTGTLALEYEAEAEDPLPGMMESFGYVKGVLAAM